MLLFHLSSSVLSSRFSNLGGCRDILGLCCWALYQMLGNQSPSKLSWGRWVILKGPEECINKLLYLLYASVYLQSGRWLERGGEKWNFCSFWGSSRSNHSRKSTSLGLQLAGEGLQCTWLIVWKVSRQAALVWWFHRLRAPMRAD